jgi:hypothetical protein
MTVIQVAVLVVFRLKEKFQNAGKYRSFRVSFVFFCFSRNFLIFFSFYKNTTYIHDDHVYCSPRLTWSNRHKRDKTKYSLEYHFYIWTYWKLKQHVQED